MRSSRRAGTGVAALVLCAAATAAAAPLSGSVVDGLTLKPIAGATVTAPGGQTATTDPFGRFRFDDLPPGPVDLQLAAAGYDGSVENVLVPEGGLTDSIFVLYTPGAAGEVVTVTDQAPVPPPPGKQDLRREEIAHIPGTRGDALQSIRSLPGVSQGGPPGFLIVRGAAPLDTKVNIDGVEVPIVYHFFGIQSVLPTEFIENIEFLPGGFGAEQGRAVGGVINVTTRSGAITEAKGFAETSFINVAGFVETPISTEHHVQMAAAVRRSIIDFILPYVLAGSNVSFTTAPSYYDAQLRVDWRPSERDRVSLVGLLDYDELALLNDNLDPNEPMLTHATFQNITSFTRAIATWQHADHGLDNRLVGSAGTGLFKFVIGDDYLDIPDTRLEIRDDVSYTVAPELRLRAGGEARWNQADVRVKFPGQPAEGEPPPANFSTLPLVTYDKTVGASLSAAYVAADLRPTPGTTLTAGLRVDHYNHIDATTVEPRLQLSQDLGARWTARAAMGSYSQPLQQAMSVATNLDPELATQYVLGADYKIRDGVTASLSGFYTDRERLVVRDPLLTQTDPLDAYVNRGYGRSFGSELLVRARLDNFFGWIAYTLSRSDRIAQPLGPRYLFDFDQTHNVIAVASYTRGKWQFGARWQYATGTPMTPIIGSTYLSDANVYLPTYGALNSDRMGAAHQLDIRIDRKVHTKHVDLSWFLDVQNVYAHAQVLGYNYNFDFSQKKPTTALPILPAAGFRATF
jgi:TonB dependent receptor-like, beta-barrel/Carboxypeptidase regulatory-like domain/TonB-dependent Receptor Plug Domain